MLKTAVIIAGGEGSRLKPLTNDKPKTLVEVAGKPMLQWIIEWLKNQGITHLVIGVAYKKEKIYEFLKQNNNFGLEVDVSEHTLDGGTAEGFHLAINRFVKDEDFIAMNGDELTNLQLSNLIQRHDDLKPLITMAIAPFHCRFSVVKKGSDNKVTGFEYGPKLQDIPVSIGIYIFNSKLINLIPATGSIEDLVFTKLAKEGKIAAYMLSEKEDWISVNNAKDIQEAENKIKKWAV
ncbi:MAG: nucleotidyltransferase family protein [Candidatus Micrarchaeota archaeon]|nr:nucleotidyltransferase family protein [Candidatus Micrarchaeota archaeon]